MGPSASVWRLLERLPDVSNCLIKLLLLACILTWCLLNETKKTTKVMCRNIVVLAKVAKLAAQSSTAKSAFKSSAALDGEDNFETGKLK